jgi:hypothetical protein
MVAQRAATLQALSIHRRWPMLARCAPWARQDVYGERRDARGGVEGEGPIWPRRLPFNKFAKNNFWYGLFGPLWFLLLRLLLFPGALLSRLCRREA